MIGGIEETSASFEARYAPRSYPTTLGQTRRFYDARVMSAFPPIAAVQRPSSYLAFVRETSTSLK